MTVTCDDLRKLAPFRTLPEPVVVYLAEVARVVKLLPGDDFCYYWQGESEAAFLLEGELKLQPQGGEPNLITAGSTQANFPLQLYKDHAGQAVSIGASAVITLQSGILESVDNLWGQSSFGETAGIEMVDGGIENEIYMEFYRSVQNGNCELPSLPDIVTRVRNAITRNKVDNRAIARIIQTDPALTARIIQAANSAFFPGGNNVTNCHNAVTRLGLETTQNLVTGFVLRQLFVVDSKTVKQQMERLWNHSRKVAAICYVLARISPNLDPDRAMLAGLVHDIGAVAVLKHAQDYDELLQSPELLQHTVDNLQADLGVMVMREWGFPPEFVNVALHGEDWLWQSDGETDYTDLVIIAQLHAFVGTQRMRFMPPPDLVPAYRKIAGGKMEPEMSIKILKKAKEELQLVERLLDG